MFPAHHNVPQRGIKANIWSSLPLIRWPFKRLPWLSCTLVTYLQWSCSVSPVKAGTPERQRALEKLCRVFQGALLSIFCCKAWRTKKKNVSLVIQTICWIQPSSLLLFFWFHHALSLNYSVVLALKSQFCQVLFIHTPSFCFFQGVSFAIKGLCYSIPFYLIVSKDFPVKTLWLSVPNSLVHNEDIHF